LKELKEIQYLCEVEKSERSIKDFFLIIDYLLKTDLFKIFKTMKIDDTNFINLLISLCLESDFLLFKNSFSAIYNFGDTATHFYLILKGKVSVYKAIEEKKVLSNLEYLDYLKIINERNDKILLEKTIQANNHILYVNKIEEESDIRNILYRETTHEIKNNFSIFQILKTSELENFYSFGGKAFESKYKKRSESIVTEGNDVVVLAIEENIYMEKILKEFHSYKMRETKFLNENFFMQNISRFNFNKIFDFFKFKEYKKGDVIIDTEKDIHNKKEFNSIYFLREGVLDVTIYITLLELIDLIKSLVYKRDEFIKDFFNDIDLDMKNQPEKFIEEFKKKKTLNLFRLTGYDCIGLEQLYYNKKILYQATVSSDSAKLYELDVGDIRKIFLINKNSFNSFDSYVNKKLRNLVKRLISWKQMIIQKIDSNDDYLDSQNKESSTNTHINSNNTSKKYSNKNNNIFKKESNTFNCAYLTNSKKYSFISKSNNIISPENIFNSDKRLQKYEANNIMNSGTTDLNVNNAYNININSQSVKVKRINSTNNALERRSRDQIKKYKIIEEGEDLNIFYKNHKTPREFSKINDKLFTMLNTSTKYTIPNIEKIIQEEVEKTNKPLSELKREKLNSRKMLSAHRNKNSSSSSVIEKSSKINAINKKLNTSVNLNNFSTCSVKKDIIETNILVENKFTNCDLLNDPIPNKSIHKKNSYTSNINCNMENNHQEYSLRNNNDNNKNILENGIHKEFIKNSKILKINTSAYCINIPQIYCNDIFSNTILSPSLSINCNSAFQNIENVLKKEHLNLLISKKNNYNIFNQGKKFYDGFKYNALNFLNSNSYGSYYINENNNSVETPLNIYNYSHKNFDNQINPISFEGSTNNIKKYTLKRLKKENHFTIKNIYVDNNRNTGKHNSINNF